MTLFYIGIMSGTSLDGIDLALAKIEDNKTTCIATHDYPIPQMLRETAQRITQGEPLTIQELGTFDHQLGHLYADAVLDFLAQHPQSRSSIRAIGCHGQTVFHQPTGDARFTMQLGDANIIAARTGIDVVADFRRKDMALGGQGAPLVPAFHQTLFTQVDKTRVVLNIGGIANVSILHASGDVLGFDTGPGNGLLDAWCEKHTGQAFDLNGEWACQGKVIPALLSALLSDVYFNAPTPKSTGREYFNLNWLTQFGVDKYSAKDVQRTLIALTARSICDAVSPYQCQEILLCGGGAHNPLIISDIKALQPESCHITTTRSIGINSDYMEALAFAWLAYCRVHHINSNLISVTGASRSIPLGVIYPAD